MKGIQFVVDDSGKRRAVLIDLRAGTSSVLLIDTFRLALLPHHKT